MNNKVIIGVIVAVLVIGGGWYFMSGKQGASSVVEGGNSTMNQLLASKEDLECVYTQVNDQASTNGILYVSGGKVRGDFTVEVKAASGVQAQTFSSHLVTDGKQVWLWPLSPEMPNQGVSIAVDPTKKDEVNLDQSFNADCKAWTKDDAKFIAPTEVQFSDAADLEKAIKAQAEQQAAAAAASEIKTDVEPIVDSAE